MDADKKRALIERFLDAYNRFDIEGMIEVLHPDIEFRNITGGNVDATASGLKEFRALAEQSAKLFESRKQAVITLDPSSEGVSVEIEFTGVLAMDIPNGPKAGETLELQGHSEYVFREEKIYQLTAYS